ncbi:MAG: acyltransferase [Bryobacteraceae bacterium]|nr:acyltransferase [Bryobacteraceae bacterium]
MPGSPLLFAPHTRNARIDVAAGSILANGVELLCRQRIAIGERTLIGAGTRVLDSDFHDLSRADRLLPGPVSPVSIGSEVWIGVGATLLKGVVIEDGAVVGACSVVRGSVGTDEVVAGNPARPLSRKSNRNLAAGVTC